MRRLVIRWTRRWLAPAVACACSAVAIGSVALLQARADDSRDAQLKLAHVQTVLNHLQSDPFKANAHTGGSPEYRTRADRRRRGDDAAFGFFYRRAGQAVAGLRQAQRERERLLARTVEVAEHERIRVAHEIHDVPIQQLTAVALNLDRFERKLASGDVGGAGDLAAAARDDTASVISSLRRLMVELRPPVLDERGLVPSLRDCAQEMFAGSATTIG